MLTLGFMASAGGDGTELPAPSFVGSFSQLPSQEYGADSVAPEACPLVLVAARAHLVVIREDARSDNTLATTRDGPGAVGTVEPSPRCDERALQCHVGWSDSLAQ